MPSEDSHDKITAFEQQVETLRATIAHTAISPEVIPELLEALRASLEELRVAEEDLSQQHNDLAVARHRLETAQQRYQALFEFAPDGYLVTNHLGVIQEVNHAGAALLAMSPSHLIGQLLVSYVPPTERQS